MTPPEAITLPHLAMRRDWIYTVSSGEEMHFFNVRDNFVAFRYIGQTAMLPLDATTTDHLFFVLRNALELEEICASR